MLQQTQVSRVEAKWRAWCDRYGGFAALAGATNTEVLAAWQGMGYNRRALWLKRAAIVIVSKHGGKLPRDVAALMQLPGIGANTAGSIAAFAYNEPTVFIETNIRRVYIHEFFAGAVAVGDKVLLPLIEQTLDRANPREWYWALMDYGTHLARTVPNPNRSSRAYRRQSVFEGSLRQMRGEILRQLVANGPSDLAALSGDPRLDAAVEALAAEGAIESVGRKWQIAK